MAARSAVVMSPVSRANAEIRCRVAANSLSRPNRASSAATFRDSAVSCGLAADTVARCGSAGRVVAGSANDEAVWAHHATTDPRGVGHFVPELLRLLARRSATVHGAAPSDNILWRAAYSPAAKRPRGLAHARTSVIT